MAPKQSDLVILADGSRELHRDGKLVARMNRNEVMRCADGNIVFALLRRERNAQAKGASDVHG